VKGIVIEGIIVSRIQRDWCALVVNCDNVTVRNYKAISSNSPSTDGFNPVNSRNVTIEDSFFHTNDDCIAIKGNMGGSVLKKISVDPSGLPAVEDILVRRCVLWSDFNNVICIGAETRAIRCDLDPADPRHAYRECDLREHPRRTDRQPARQAGGPRSHFAGFAADKPIQNVTIEGVRYGDTLIRDAKSMGLGMNPHVSGVRFLHTAEKPRPAPAAYAKPDAKAGPLWLTFGSGFAPGADASDGVRLSVRVWTEGADRHDTLLDTIVTPSQAWREHAVNLSSYAGRKARIRFTADPGLTTSYDWFQWGDPRVLRLGPNGTETLLDVEGLFGRSTRGVAGWPYGEIQPLAGGAQAELRAGKDASRRLDVGGIRKPGIFLHPAWQDGRHDPVFVQWTMDLPGT